MPTKYKRDCDFCGEYYEGYGVKYCSLTCQGADRTTPSLADLPDAPDETVSVQITDEWGNVSVAASASIKTPEELFKRSELDPEVWEIVPDSGSMRKWDVPMRLDTGPVVIPCYYVGIRVRKRWEASEVPAPLVLKVTRPKRQKPTPGAFTSVHYSDSHVPHHDPRALNILYQIIDFVNPGLTVDHGDLLDCGEIGRYDKDPYNRVSLKEEIQMGAEVCGTVHALTPAADHVLLEGNHEARLRKAIWQMAENRQAGEVLTLPGVREALEWRSLLGIGELGWEWVGYTGGGGPNHKLLFDRIILKHGDVARAGSAVSARTECSKYNKSGMSGHTHRQGTYMHRDYNGTHAWWELGMLGKIRNDYVGHADWQQGFACVTWSDDRKRFGVELVSINDGVAYFRGRRFEGDSSAFGVLAAA